jgi:hypothetical protein
MIEFNRVVRRVLALGVLAGALAACADTGPTVDDRFRVYTPIFADNRVYYLKKANSGKQQLEPLGNAADEAAGEKPVPRNSALSIVLRSIEIPARVEGGPIRGAADYAVILDIGTASDGSSQSLVVWYQRGVQPDQSLNFSNLLVFYEPRWDERIAPYFRVRVMDVTTERNAETRRALDRASNLASTVGVLAGSPLVAPLIGVAFTAAELVLANQQNRMVLDYSVQLYSSAAAAEAGSGQLCVMKRGSYIVVGRPNSEPRSFWTQPFAFETESRILEGKSGRVNVPVALITVGTFDSIVPKLVLERSAALTQILASNAGSTIEQVNEAARRLNASAQAFVMGERVLRYRDHNDIDRILATVTPGSEIETLLGAEDTFFLLRAANRCFDPDKPFTSLQDLRTYRTGNASAPCKAG